MPICLMTSPPVNSLDAEWQEVVDLCQAPGTAAWEEVADLYQAPGAEAWAEGVLFPV